ncbi:MAG TPA: iron-containing alcohol dehydrogenase [Pseudothermotoga sp.]|nr:iron-containing alcohol dehydrogenase [Pseudothermotoga sp.]HOK83807.1 iron-containing alcohol dehydrogenase [Pseudothermotoga sp.]HPP70289.1 iron-containing alcohol dehydrogenase [Pseudothermotoga sp.]
MIDFLGKTIQCGCGKVHKIPAIEIVCGRKLGKLSDFFDDAIFVADQNTVLLAEIPTDDVFVFTGPERVMATMENVQRVVDFLKGKNYRQIVSIGSGSLTDIARYSAFLCKVDFSCFPTAPSVDAYTSSVAPLIVEGVKKTLDAKIPRKILIDTDVIVNSPIDLLRAGIGDISSKVTARLDWVMSNFLTGEQICDFVWDDIKDLLKLIMKDVRKILQRDESAVQNLMKAQLISGLNIAITGNSRPASGADHLISHVLEMYQECRGHLPLFHGLQVAMGTYISLKAYDALFQDLRFKKSQILLKDRKKLLVDFFGQQIANEFEKTYLNKKRVETINVDNIRRRLQELYLEYRPILESSLLEMGVRELFSRYDRDFVKSAIVVSTMIRNRYTILDLYDQLDILDDFCDWVTEQF